uniref:Aminotransferase class V domain-containing protein n=1 Tax=Biomphalaria glabrata TaxID=6526 RepID=A0A2C9M1P3_BIOGL
MMHKYGGLAFFDFACAAPYVEIDMNCVQDGPDAYKDAIFISTHKFLGGPQTPGILIAKKWVFRNQVPHGVGGGTVVFVRRQNHKYYAEPEHREEGGTPAIIESIRAGLVFKLKETFTSQFIMERETEYFQQAVSAWSKHPDLLILGCIKVERLPIFSLLFRNPHTGRLLHHDFVALVLNQLFGLQVRSGCACAALYGL